MVLATKIQEEYRRHLNRVNASYDQRIGIIDADGFINEGIDIVFENFAYKFETNTTLRNHLRQLEVKGLKRDVIKRDKDSSIIEYPEDLYMLTRQYVKACKDGCDTEKVLNLYIIQSSDLTNSLKDPNWKPSFEWEQALAEDAGNNLIIYHNCEFNIKTVEIDYLKKPIHIATPSLLKTVPYVKDGKTITKNIDFEVDSTFFWRKAVRVAVLNTKIALGNRVDYETELQAILALDKIFIN